MLRVATYRIGVSTGLHPVRWQRGAAPAGPFYGRSQEGAAPAPASTAWATTASLFGRATGPLSDEPPDWLSDPLSGSRMPDPGRPWWRIRDFDRGVGDIKLVWEMSRMDWVIPFAQRGRNGDRSWIQRLNEWLSDWNERNPPYRGPNWKCGQEASIRVLNLAMGALILGQVREALPGLQELIRLHLKRISPTLHYAMAQDNNHGTSEAAALFIGGSWLAASGFRAGSRWEAEGRRWLEDRVARLVGRQGTFSQYSLNYHRVLLDTLSMAEVWRRRAELPEFSACWNEHAAAAARWLYHMISPEHGDGPNVGANDGARLLPLTDTDYRDYRGSVQLAMALFTGSRAYAGAGSWDHGLAWLGVAVPETAAPSPGNYVADDGGFAVLRRGEAKALLRYPRYRFRPGHADALHLDLWIGGLNLLRDGGSFSYHTADPRWERYFTGTESHNTVQFDGRDQMQRLGRFLFGDWLEPSFVDPLVEDQNGSAVGAGYRDRFGARHERRVRLSESGIRVTDGVGGFSERAVMRWRLAPGPLHLTQESPSRLRVTRDNGNGASLTVESSVPIQRGTLVEGWESRYYMEKTPVPVLEIEVREPAVLTTEVLWVE